MTRMLKRSYILIFISTWITFSCTPRYTYSSRHTQNKAHNPSYYKSEYDEYNWDNIEEDINDTESDYYQYNNSSSKENYKDKTKVIKKVSYSKTDEEDNHKNKYQPNKINMPSQNNKKYPPVTKELDIIRNKPQKEVMHKSLYTIKKGDSLIKISRKFNIPLDNLCELNNLSKNDDIRPGMKLKLCRQQNIETPTQALFEKDNDLKKSKMQNKPSFKWPIMNVLSTKNDGQDGVKPIGIFIKSKTDSAVLSSADGTVKKIGYMRGYGEYIIIKHENKYHTIYSNLKNISVKEGQRINAGKSLGQVDGDKLHFQIDCSGKPINPLQYLKRQG